jgi:hydroxypyruvate reductase
MPTPLFQERRQHTSQLIQAALDAVNPGRLVSEHLHLNQQTLIIGDNQPFNLAKGRVFLVSVGKAALQMAAPVVDRIGRNLAGGVVITKKGFLTADDSQPDRSAAYPVQYYEAGHPVPDETGVKATTAVHDLLSRTTKDDLVLCLISGGTSALLTQPLIPPATWQELNASLLAAGCSIQEFNTVRRQFDEVKGGGLARIAAPAVCITLILSDVIGNSLAAIGSGPTVLGPDDPEAATEILIRYNLASRLKSETWQILQQVLAGRQKRAEKPLLNVYNQIIGDVSLAAQAAVQSAAATGFSTALLTTHLEGEAREVGRVVAALGKDSRPNSCLVLGGETTVSIRGSGLGGRNLELALSAAVTLDGQPQTAVVAFATDGDDGPTGAAGAIVTGETVQLARKQGLNPAAYLDNNDSYHFFNRLGDHLIKTGPTGTNVNDLIFIMHYKL